MSDTHYSFYSAMRRGLNTEISGHDDLRGTINATLHVEARKLGSQNSPTKSLLTKKVAVYGPADVRGFNTRVIVRTDPKSSPEIGDFEPNFFPMIEFAEPDFAWRFSPVVADKQTGELQPWIALIVLKEDEFDEGAPTEDNLSQWIRVKKCSDSLPDLAQVWRWAHVQIIGDKEGEDGDNKDIVHREPNRAVCRLLCPRKLEAKTRYTAFVVPTFALGVYAGLDQKPPEGFKDATTRAWDEDSDSIELPYYYKWSFGTGLRGDFEYAVRLLKFRELEGIGTRPLDVSMPGYRLPGVNRPEEKPESAYVVGMEGALRSLDPLKSEDDETWNLQLTDDAFRKALASLLNRELNVTVPTNDYITDVHIAIQQWGRGAMISWYTMEGVSCAFEFGADDNQVEVQPIPIGSGKYAVELNDLQPGVTYPFTISVENDSWLKMDFTIPLVPSVLPPIYGRWHSARSYVDAESSEEPTWLRELNLQPRYRAAAGLGSLVVRKQQEALMASAWDQLGAIEPANDIIRRAQFGREATGSIYQKLSELNLDGFLQITGPVHRRTRLDYCKEDYGDNSGKTACAYFNTMTTVANALFDPAFQRIARPRGAFRKRQKNPGDQLVQKLFSRQISAAGEYYTPEGTLLVDFGDLNRNVLPNLPTNMEVPIYEALQALARLQSPDVTTDEPPEDGKVLRSIRDAMLCALDPNSTICDRTRARVHLSGVQRRERGDCLERIMAYPEFPQPMYKALLAISQDLIAPGLDRIPLNTVGLLVTNRRFVESYLVGLNHEFASELLWREYPTDQRGSYFRQFWDPSDSLPPANERDALSMESWQKRHKDIRSLHEWNSALGNHRVVLDGMDAIKEKVVLVIRGDLLKKHPDTRIYAVEAKETTISNTESGAGENGDSVKELVPGLPEFCDEDAQPVTPVFSAQVPPDITFLGFDFGKETALGDGSKGQLGMFFVFEERPMETRFGLDEDDGSPPDVLENWSNLSWAHVTCNPGGYISMGDQAQGPVIAHEDWTESNGATVARITLQKAFRLSIHANKLIAG